MEGRLFHLVLEEVRLAVVLGAVALGDLYLVRELKRQNYSESTLQRLRLINRPTTLGLGIH